MKFLKKTFRKCFVFLAVWNFNQNKDKEYDKGYDKESCVVIMNRSEYFKKLQHMINEGIQNGVYIVTEGRILEDLNCSVVFYTVTLRNMNITKRCYQRQINQDNCMELLKHASLTTLQIIL